MTARRPWVSHAAAHVNFAIGFQRQFNLRVVHIAADIAVSIGDGHQVAQGDPLR